MKHVPKSSSRQNIDIDNSDVTRSQFAIAGGNLLQVSINISVEFIEKYIIEYVRASERRIIFILIALWSLNLVLANVTQFSFLNKDYVRLFSQGIYGFTLISIIWICTSISIRNYSHNKTFWKFLSMQDRLLIDQYLDEAEAKIRGGFEFTFDPEKNYVSLSGSLSDLYPHTACEENLPSGRRYIKNLDTYLLHPLHRKVFVYGTPGSGKSTTLYKTFLNYKKSCSARKGNHIPVFIHASQVARIVKQSDIFTNSVDFLEKIYELTSSETTTSFIKLLRRNSKIKLVLIVDALDEFVDKKDRSQLFNYLAGIIKITSRTGTKWILSCREEEYKAYSDKLDVLNVRVQPMNLSQFSEFLRKSLRENVAEFSKKDLVRLRKNLLAIRRAQGQRETFLSNPYYLALWLHLLAFSDKGLNPNVPSIDELHRIELQREIIKGMGRSPAEFEKVEHNLVERTIAVLSVLSFHLLRESLLDQAHQGILLSDSNLIAGWKNILLPITQDSYDQTTLKRSVAYSNSILTNKKLQPLEEDATFVGLVQVLKPSILSQKTSVQADRDKLVNLLILVASIIDQANTNNIIKLEINGGEACLLGFFNQRARDYLTAHYLKSFGLDRLLRESRINFWLSRSIAIAIAIADDPQKILTTTRIPQDAVLESAIVDGLTLIPSDQKSSIINFVNILVQHLLNEKRIFGTSSDPCDPLRVLREVRRLCLNGYSSHIKLPTSLFRKLLRHTDAGIAESATITLLTYACQVNFDNKIFYLLLSHFLRKALTFELVSEGSLVSFWLAIKEAKR